jgi:recombination protein RecT
MATSTDIAKLNERAIQKGDVNPIVPLLKKGILNFALKIDETKWTGYVVSAMMKNPKLSKCTPESIVGGVMILAAVDLPPIAGLADLIPYWNSSKGCMEAHAQFGYKGVLQISYRNEAVLSISAEGVGQNEIDKNLFAIDAASTNPVRHQMMLTGDKGPIVGYYAVAQLKGGVSKAVWMTTDEIIAHAKAHSKAYGDPNSPWTTAFGEMAKKTVAMRLTKMLPMDIHTRQALAADETSRSYIPGAPTPFDLPDTTDWAGNGGKLDPEAKQPEDLEASLPPAEVKKEQPAAANDNPFDAAVAPENDDPTVVQGEVLKVFPKTTAKGKVYYSYKLDVDGIEVYVNMWSNEAKAKAGDDVEFGNVEISESGGKKFRWAKVITIVNENKA